MVTSLHSIPCLQEVTKLKEDRLAEEESLKAAKAQRTKEHGNFVNEAWEWDDREYPPPPPFFFAFPGPCHLQLRWSLR